MSGTATSLREPAGGLARDRTGDRTGSVRPVRRVRHEVRDGIAVMAFSALASTAFGALLTVLAHVGN